MWVPPIIERELRVATHKSGALKSRFLVATVGTAIVFLSLLLFRSGFAGQPLRKIFLYGGLYLAVMPAAQASVGLFCEERRNQTLELLYLTGMGAGELFIGKLLGGFLIASSELLALAPFMAVPFMSGGLSRDLFFATVACFPILLFATLAIGTLASVCCKDDGAAWGGAVGLIALVCLAVPLPYFLGYASTGAVPFSAKWLCFSPAFGPYLVATNFFRYSPKYFWANAAITLAMGMCALALAALILNRNWRQQIVMLKGSSGWRGKWQNFVHGSSAWRQTLRKKLLPMHAYQWLVEQNRRPLLTAWAFVATIVFIWLMGWLAWPRAWPTPMNFYITAFILIIGVQWIKVYAAARQMGFDRRDGGLELLLTTPLDPAEIVDGQLAALRSQFRPVKWALVGLFALMMFGGYWTRSWTPGSRFSFFAIWFFLILYAVYERNGMAGNSMWVALNTGRPSFAMFRTSRSRFGMLQHWYWFYWMWSSPGMFRGLLHAGKFPSGSPGEIGLISFVGLFLLSITIVMWNEPPAMRINLVREMRSIAREPVPDADDPRLKKWDPSKRLPAAT